MPRTEVFNREEVITQARQTFWEKGYNGTSMQDLVDTTGLNRSSIYNSFGSKMELYKICLKDYDKGSMKFLQSACDSLSPIEKLRWIFERLVNTMTKDAKDLGCMMINCRTEMWNQENSIDRILGKNQEEMIAHFQQLLETSQADGIIDKHHDTSYLAHFLFSSFQGLRLMGMVSKDKETLLGVVDHVFKSIK